MKLISVQVQGYRSVVDRFSVDLGDGMNSLVGKNNCGKSNILTAITLAMDPEASFDKSRDTPQQMQWSVPRIALDFYVHGTTSPEKTLLRYADEYEIGAGADPNSTLSSSSRIRYIVEFRNGIRQEYFQVAGAGGRRPASDNEQLQKLHAQFLKTVRFVLVRSGESLESLLNGRFKDILQLVLKDHLRDGVSMAEQGRQKYIDELRGTLLGPLQNDVVDTVKKVFPEINYGSLVPAIPAIDETLAGMRIELTDSADTDLIQKGAGVRGGVLLALLNYLANQSRRSVVFAVEEPEAFLHPGAQEDLRDGLERLAARSDVTLLTTTHSPFIVSRKEDAKVIVLTKDTEGKTILSTIQDGSNPKAASVSDLFRDPGIGDLLSQVIQISGDTSMAVLVVEGETDRQYLRIAAQKSGRSKLLTDIKIVVAGGAEKAVVQAILLRNSISAPIFVLLDHDANGRSAADKLVALAGFSKKTDLISMQKYQFNSQAQDVEAEDLWPEALLDRFVQQYGDVVLAEKKRVGKTDCFQYGFTATGKDHIGEWLSANANLSDCEKWVQLLDDLASKSGASIN